MTPDPRSPSTAHPAAPVPTPPSVLVAFAFLIAAMTMTGANVMVGKVIVSEFDVFAFLAVRFVIATAALALIARPADWRQIRNPDSTTTRDVFVLAFFGSVLFTILLLEGTKRTTASSAGIITATLPAVIAILAIVALSQRLTRAGALCIALSVFGVAVMQLGPASSGAASEATQRAISWLGNSLVGLAVLCEAIFVLSSKRAASRLSPVALSFLVSAAGLALSAPLAVPAVLNGALAVPSMTTWLLAIWYALSASIFCTVLWYRGAPHTPSWQAGLATTAIPVTAIAMGIGLLGERLTIWQGIGAILVITAIVVAALNSRARS